MYLLLTTDYLLLTTDYRRSAQEDSRGAGSPRRPIAAPRGIKRGARRTPMARRRRRLRASPRHRWARYKYTCIHAYMHMHICIHVNMMLSYLLVTTRSLHSSDY